MPSRVILSVFLAFLVGTAVAFHSPAALLQGLKSQICPSGNGGVRQSKAFASNLKCVMNAKRPGEPQLKPAEFQDFYSNVIDQVNERDRLRQQMLTEEGPPLTADSLSKAALNVTGRIGSAVSGRIGTAGQMASMGIKKGTETMSTAGQLASQTIKKGTESIRQGTQSLTTAAAAAAKIEVEKMNGPMAAISKATQGLVDILLKAIAIAQSTIRLGWSKIMGAYLGVVGYVTTTIANWQAQFFGFFEKRREAREAKIAAELKAKERAERAERARIRREEAKIRNKQRWDYVKGVVSKGVEKSLEASNQAAKEARTVADSAQRMAPGLMVLGAAAAAVDLTDVALASAAGLMFTTSVVDLAVTEKKKQKEAEKVQNAVQQAAQLADEADVVQASYLESLAAETEHTEDSGPAPADQPVGSVLDEKATEEDGKAKD